MAERPLASVSLDLDNLWSYLKTHGDPGWESRPTYLPRFVPLLLDHLAALRCRITVFVVGLDAAREENREALRVIPDAGHEIGNHSYEHEPWLQRYERSQLEADLIRAEEAIVAATGCRPTGFRGPGFSWSADLLELLAERGYEYDASTFPTFIGPLARAYYFRSARLSETARAHRGLLFGGWAEGFRPLRPYFWSLRGGRRLLEIPVTTMPLLRVPFHLSYLLYLARFSEGLMRAYLDLAVRGCRVSGVEPSFLLHPLDLLGGDDVPALRFFPGMDLPTSRKVEIFHRVLRRLGETFTLVPMGVHARALFHRPETVARWRPAPA
jgi:hypothetical protein